MKSGIPCRSAILGVFFLSFFCISNSAGTILATQWPEVRPLGCYTSLRGDNRQVSGFTVRLWMSTIGMLGIVDYHRSLYDDPPMGVLTDIQFNPGTRKISFQSKLTDGLHTCREHKNVPSQILLSFQGVLGHETLKGTFILTDQLHASRIVATHKDFMLSRNSNCHLDSYNSIDIWWWYWEPAYESRGPRW